MIEQIANHLWQSTLFALAVVALTPFFRRSGAHVRYWMWFSASIKFFVPFALLITLGRQLEWAPAVREAASPAVSAAADRIGRISEPFFETTTVSGLPGLPSSAPTINWFGRVLPAVWACGCIALVLIRIRQWRRIRTAVRASTLSELPGLAIPPGMQVRSAQGLLEPGVVGWWHPTLLLPAGLEHHLTGSQLRAVIAHEVSHVRRRDNLTAAVHMLVETFFWFHPLVWWIGARLVDERERACDEEVLRLLGEPVAYAEGILAVCRRYAEAQIPCVSGISGSNISGSNIRKRIEAIMSNSIGIRLSFARKTLLAAAALFALGVPIVVGSMTSALRLEPQSAVSAAIQSVEFPKPQPVKPAIIESAQVTKSQLAKPQAPPPPVATAVGQFEEASIRPCDANSLPPVPEGARGGGANSFQMTPGRTHALCMTLATLIRTAYGYGPADLEFLMQGSRGRGMSFNNVYGLGVEDGVRVRGGPDWIRQTRYTIEAVAAGPSDAATMQGPMLRALLESRFQLKTHIETEQVPAFALTAAKGGLKIKPAEDGACARMPAPTPGVPNFIRPVSLADVRRGEKPTCGLSFQRNGPNRAFVGGEATLGSLATALGDPLGRVRVLDQTGITDKFNFVLEFAVDENAPGGPGFESPQDAQAPDVPRGSTIFTAIQEQLGLRLEPARTPREFLVIDRVEKPSPN